MVEDFLSLVSAREGHFRLESGHHSKLWLDLDRLFVEPNRVRPLVDGLAQALGSHDFTAVCGPLVGGAFLAQTLASALQVEFFFTERVLPPDPGGFYRAGYRLPSALHDRARGKRVAIVDDVISAGSAVRGTYLELKAHYAHPTVIGALLLLGSMGSTYFAQERVPLVSMARLPYEIWVPDDCPQCAAAMPLEDVAMPTPL